MTYAIYLSECIIRTQQTDTLKRMGFHDFSELMDGSRSSVQFIVYSMFRTNDLYTRNCGVKNG